MGKIFVGLINAIKSILLSCLEFRRQKKNDSELWQAFLKAQEETEAAWVRFGGEEDDEGNKVKAGDHSDQSLEEFYAARAAETETFFAFFGDRRLHQEDCVALEAVRKFDELLTAARANRDRLRRLNEGIRLPFNDTEDLAAAIEMRSKLRTKEEERRATDPHK